MHWHMLLRSMSRVTLSIQQAASTRLEACCICIRDRMMCQSAARTMPRPRCCGALALCRAERDSQVRVFDLIGSSRTLGNDWGDRPGQLVRICAPPGGRVRPRRCRAEPGATPPLRCRRNNWPVSAAPPEDDRNPPDNHGR